MFKNIKYKDPNKYIIKKKVFIRDFKKLYEKIKDPWNQHKNFYEEECVSISLNFIKKICENKLHKNFSLLDIGAGQGSLKKYLNKNIIYKGIDIHKQNFKNVEYSDITVSNPKFKKKYDLIVCFKTIYYLGDQIDKVLKIINSYLKKNGYLFISYNLKKNSFSNKYLDDLKLRKKMKILFNEIYTIEINRHLQLEKNKEKNTLLVFKKK